MQQKSIALGDNMAERAVQTLEAVQAVKFWSGIVDGDTTEPLTLPNGVLSGSVRVDDEGSWGNEAVTIEGSFDGTNWAALDDINGTSMALTDEGIYNFVACVPYIRATPASGLVGTVGVYMMIRS